MALLGHLLVVSTPSDNPLALREDVANHKQFKGEEVAGRADRIHVGQDRDGCPREIVGLQRRGHLPGRAVTVDVAVLESRYLIVESASNVGQNRRGRSAQES